jgi:hypothetical protein
MTVVMWSYENGDREININNIEADVFEKIRPAFDIADSTDDTGRITISENTKIIFHKNKYSTRSRKE